MYGSSSFTATQLVPVHRADTTPDLHWLEGLGYTDTTGVLSEAGDTSLPHRGIADETNHSRRSASGWEFQLELPTSTSFRPFSFLT